MHPQPPSPSTASAYNQIKPFHEQTHDIDANDLSTLAEVLVKHGEQSCWGIALLHRHHELPAGHAMVRLQTDTDEEICRIKPLGENKLYPVSLYCSPPYAGAEKATFVEFEYSTHRTTGLSDDCLEEFASVLEHQKNSTVLGLSHVSPTQKQRVETLLPDNTGTITTPLLHEIDVSKPGVVVTLWGILSNGEDHIEIKPLQKCYEPPFGGHKPPTPPPPTPPPPTPPPPPKS